jgi:DNA polymerase
VEIFEENNAEIAAGVKKKDMKYDPYKIMAAAIYNKDPLEITDPERFVGKTTILGSGYGMGATKFRAQLKTFGVEITEEEAQRIINTYRETYPWIPALWKAGNVAIEALSKGRTAKWGREGVLRIDREGILMPNGLYQRYPNLRKVKDKDGKEQYIYDSRKGVTKLYGGKLTENICQGLARCIIGEQLLLIAKRYKVVLTVHDAVAYVAPKEEAEEAMQYVMQCMRHVPEWAQGIPLNCEAGYGVSYGEC